MLYDDAFLCMNCGYAPLTYQHCKIRCPNCGFTLDCSDLDVGGEVKRAQTSKQVLTPKARTLPDNPKGE